MRAFAGEYSDNSDIPILTALIPAAWVDAEFDHDMVRASKRLHRNAMRNVSLQTAAVALRCRRAERLARRKREKALRRAAGGIGGMQVDSCGPLKSWGRRLGGRQARTSGSILTRLSNSPRFETCIVRLK